MTTLYGIKNCDTVKKARKWLEGEDITYGFHDVRADGLSADDIERWLQKVEWETLVNKRSTTWKQLDEATRNSLDASNVVDTLLANPTLIKRPVLDHKGQVTVGFKAANYESLFS
ncbi:MAG: ArsC family reductase [Cellvibrionaceae bacterium]